MRRCAAKCLETALQVGGGVEGTPDIKAPAFPTPTRKHPTTAHFLLPISVPECGIGKVNTQLAPASQRHRLWPMADGKPSKHFLGMHSVQGPVLSPKHREEKVEHWITG